jgi:hypothetical protein
MRFGSVTVLMFIHAAIYPEQCQVSFCLFAIGIPGLLSAAAPAVAAVAAAAAAAPAFSAFVTCVFLAQGCQRPALTPRQWLDQRWLRQASSGSSQRHKLAAAAVDLPLPPTRSFLATQNSNSNGSSSSSALQWDSLLVSSVPQQLLVAKPALPAQQQQLPKLANGQGQQQKQLEQQHHERHQQQQVGRHAAGARCGAEAGKHSWALAVHGMTHTTASSSSSSKASSKKASSSKLSGIAVSQQLMTAIKAARSIEQLQQLYSKSSNSMDLLHCTCMLNRLAHAWGGLQRKSRATSSSSSRQTSGDQLATAASAAELGQLQAVEVQLSRHVQPHHHHHHQQQQQQARVVQQQQQQQLQARTAAAVQLLEALLADLQQQHLAACSPRQLSSCLWVVGKFSRAVAGSAALQQAAAAVLGQLLAPAAAAAAVQPVRLGDSLNGHTAVVVPQQELILHDHSMHGSSSSVVTLQQRLTGQQSHRQQQQQQQAELDQQQQHQQHQQQNDAGLDQQHQQQRLVLDGANMADLGNTLWALGRLSQVSSRRQWQHTAAPALKMLC